MLLVKPMLYKKVNTLLRLVAENGVMIFFHLLIDRIAFYLLFFWLYRFTFAAYGKNIRYGRHGLYRCIPSDVRLCGINYIYFGNDVRIDHGVYIHCQNNSQGLFVGDGVRINRNVHVEVGSKIVIERCVLIAPSVLISSGKHNFHDASKPIVDQGSSATKPILVSSGAWLCERSVVLGGACIGVNSIIAANAVVKKNVPNHHLYTSITQDPIDLSRRGEGR
jgi:acetyltransferase-like isoleucine patch superfamily enzyme